jgi:hypothetical protein
MEDQRRTRYQLGAQIGDMYAAYTTFKTADFHAG